MTARTRLLPEPVAFSDFDFIGGIDRLMASTIEVFPMEDINRLSTFVEQWREAIDLRIAQQHRQNGRLS